MVRHDGVTTLDQTPRARRRHPIRAFATRPPIRLAARLVAIPLVAMVALLVVIGLFNLFLR